jgi:hypothetical protein
MFFCIYQALKDYRADGQETFFKIVLSNLDILEVLKTTNNLDMSSLVTKTESALFAVQTVLDDFLLDISYP